uniref:Uncharacterized protein n=1 Tax=Rhizophora mucronata TaxID=61149 RepID=A0A2P2Q8U6_RHIMU
MKGLWNHHFHLTNQKIQNKSQDSANKNTTQIVCFVLHHLPILGNKAK